MGEVVQLRPSQSFEPWQDAHKVAAYFDVSLVTVKRWTRQGMPSAKFGRARRYRLSECEAWRRSA